MKQGISRFIDIFLYSICIVAAFIVVVIFIGWFGSIKIPDSIISSYEWWAGQSEPHESLRNLALIIAGIIGLGLAAWRIRVANKQAEIAEQGHVTDRFSKAVELIGNKEASVRIGGLYALKHIAYVSTSNERDVVLDVIRNFICKPPYNKSQDEYSEKFKENYSTEWAQYEDECIKWKNGSREKKPTRNQTTKTIVCPDIILAFEILHSLISNSKTKNNINYVGTWFSIRKANLSFLALENVCMQGMHFSHSNFNGANIGNGDLRNSVFVNSCFIGASLKSAKLSNANFEGADLMYGKLGGIELEGTRFNSCNLSYTYCKSLSFNGDVTFVKFHNSELDHTSFENCKLNGCTFNSATMSKTKFNGANLSMTDFTGVRNLTVTEFTDAFVDKQNSKPIGLDAITIAVKT